MQRGKQITKYAVLVHLRFLLRSSSFPLPPGPIFSFSLRQTNTPVMHFTFYVSVKQGTSTGKCGREFRTDSELLWGNNAH